jgi:TolA-binding protein
MKTASILERLDDAKGASAVYAQVARDYADQNTGIEAKRSLDRLNATNK